MSSRIGNRLGAPSPQWHAAGRPGYQVYAFGLATVAAATTLCLLLNRILGISVPYVFYVLPIIATAAYGGLIPGLFVTVTSALILAIAFLGTRVFTSPESSFFII